MGNFKFEFLCWLQTFRSNSKKLLSVLNALFHLIDQFWMHHFIWQIYDLPCWHFGQNLANTLPCRAKTLVLHGLTVTVLNCGFICFKFYLDFVAQNTIRKSASSSVIAWIFTELTAVDTNIHLGRAFLIHLPTPLHSQWTSEFTTVYKVDPWLETSYVYAVLYSSIPPSKYMLMVKIETLKKLWNMSKRTKLLTSL